LGGGESRASAMPWRSIVCSTSSSPAEKSHHLANVRYNQGYVRVEAGAVAITASELRQNIYRLLDQVLESGVPVEIERRGRRLRIVPVDPPSKLDRLVPHPDAMKERPEYYVHIDWSDEWHPDSA
jgi:antitoxin (DNA-binding transcriptional repressor) of toxin-antitoxin stability system